LDVGTAMTFTPEGVMPYSGDHRTIPERGQLMKNCTYGQGMRPPVFSGYPHSKYPYKGREATQINSGKIYNYYHDTNLPVTHESIIIEHSYNKYGRDLIDSNNKIGDPYCYYTPDPKKHFLLTFKNRHLAHYEGWIDSDGRLIPPDVINGTNLPNGVVVGFTPTDEDILAARFAYNALKDFIPQKYVKNDSGVWVPAPGFEKRAVTKNDAAHEHLVPNDSRIYMMKLALWRLTEKENASMFTRVNVAAAMTFQSNTTYSYPNISTSDRVALPGAEEGQQGYYGASMPYFRYGGADDWISGIPYPIDHGLCDHVDIVYGNGKNHLAMSQFGMRGRFRLDSGEEIVSGDFVYHCPSGNALDHHDHISMPLGKAISRSILIAPFNKFYKVRSADGKIEETPKLDVFRRWISGNETYYVSDGISLVHDFHPRYPSSSSGIDQYILVADGDTLLSTAIYGGRDSSENIKNGDNFPYHKGVYFPRYWGDVEYGTNDYILLYSLGYWRNAGVAWNRITELDSSTNTEGFLTGQATGSVHDFFSPPTTDIENGVDGLDFANNTIGFFPVTGSCQQNWLVVFSSGHTFALPDYPPHEAIERLFNNTLTMRGRRYNEAAKRWEEHEYQEMDSGVRTIIVGLISPDRNDPDLSIVEDGLRLMAKAGDPIEIERLGDKRRFISNDYAVPVFINNITELPKALKAVMRRIYVEKMGSGNPLNQPTLASGNPVNQPDVIIDTRVIFGTAYRMNNLDQWDGWLTKYVIRKNQEPKIEWEVNDKMIEAGLTRRLFTSTGAANSDSRSVEQITRTVIQNRAKVASSISTRFNDWVYRFNNDDNPTSETVGVLGDMLNSGITVVGRPRHRELRADAAANTRDIVVYVQTNRGFLHAFNYLNGHEIWGFSPPNIFQGRLRNLKTTNNGSVFIDGNGYTEERSKPMVLLDGLLIARDVAYNASHKTLLTGYLGRGGNGFYAMDITNMDAQNKDPVFEWAIENPRYKDRSAPVIRWGKAAAGAYINYQGYEDLGLTIDPGVFFIPANGGANTVGVLPGGLGHKFGADSQGKSFYIFNPTDGSILWRIYSNITGFEAPHGRELGMGVSPIIYEENLLRKAVAFYTADSEGNVFKCDTKLFPISYWTMKSIFQLRTIGQSLPFETMDGTAPPYASPDKPVVIPHKMLLAKARTGQMWLFGGTSDIHGPESYGNDARKLINGEQFLFGIHTSKIFEDAPQMNSGITPSNSDVTKLPYYADGIPAKYGRYGQPWNSTQIKGIKYGMDKFGWVLRLRPKFGVTEAEYLSADPFMFNEILYFATFIPLSGLSSEAACTDIGVAKLYMLDPSTGSSWLQSGPAMVLENVKIAGISGNPSKDRLTLSIKELKHNSLESIQGKFKDYKDLGNGLIEIAAPVRYDKGYMTEHDSDFEELVPHVQYWRNRL